MALVAGGVAGSGVVIKARSQRLGVELGGSVRIPAAPPATNELAVVKISPFQKQCCDQRGVQAQYITSAGGLDRD